MTTTTERLIFRHDRDCPAVKRLQPDRCTMAASGDCRCWYGPLVADLELAGVACIVRRSDGELERIEPHRVQIVDAKQDAASEKKSISAGGGAAAAVGRAAAAAAVGPDQLRGRIALSDRWARLVAGLPILAVGAVEPMRPEDWTQLEREQAAAWLEGSRLLLPAVMLSWLDEVKKIGSDGAGGGA